MILNGGKIYNSRIVFDDDSLKAIAEATGTRVQDYRDGLQLKHLSEGWKGCYFISAADYAALTEKPLAPYGFKIKTMGRGGKGHGAALPKNVQIKE